VRLTALKTGGGGNRCLHEPKGRSQTSTSTDRGAEPSFLAGRASLLSQADQDLTHRVAEPSFPRGGPGPAPCHRMECHTVWAPFRGNAGGTGAFGGPFLPGQTALSQEGGQSELSRNQWSQTRAHKADQ
jgi:hypothetical protein